MIAPLAKLLKRIRGFLERSSRLVAAACIICFAFGLALSHRIARGRNLKAKNEGA